MLILPQFFHLFHPAVHAIICLPISIHLDTLSTGMTHLAPLYKAVAIVEDALSTSMITTILLPTSYKCKGREKGMYVKWACCSCCLSRKNKEVMDDKIF